MQAVILGLVISFSFYQLLVVFPAQRFEILTTFFVLGAVYYLYKTVMSFLEEGQTSPWFFAGFMACFAMSVRCGMQLTTYFNIW